MNLRKPNGNGHDKPSNGKCKLDEALEALSREAQEVIEATRARREKREARSVGQ